MNEELRRLYEADQADRQRWVSGPPEGDEEARVIDRDRARRRRTAELVEAGALAEAADYFHATMLFQHGETPADYERARALAERAAALGHPTGRWLAAAAHDRWLTHQGQPQKYGTQYTLQEGQWVLAPVDPATTDAERAAAGVPPLAEAPHRYGRPRRGRRRPAARLRDARAGPGGDRAAQTTRDRLLFECVWQTGGRVTEALGLPRSSAPSTEVRGSGVPLA